MERNRMKILIIDDGGTHVIVRATSHEKRIATLLDSKVMDREMVPPFLSTASRHNALNP